MALFGSNAGPAMIGPNVPFSVEGVVSTYYGHLAAGAGGSQGAFSYLVTPYEALNARARVDGTVIRWILNNTYTAASTASTGGSTGFGGSSNSSGGGGGPGIAARAAVNIAVPSGGVDFDQTIPAYAATASVCLAFINANAGEGADRTELRDAEQDTLVATVADNCNNTVVVLNTVGPYIMDNWIEHENVTAVLYSSLLG